jgi:MFS transporter, ACDE family, multidrug resistance protein
MLVAPAERPVAPAACGFVRFIGGGLAPYCAARLAASFNVHVPFYLGAAGIGVLAFGHSLLSQAEVSGRTSRTRWRRPTAPSCPPGLAHGSVWPHVRR